VTRAREAVSRHVVRGCRSLLYQREAAARRSFCRDAGYRHPEELARRRDAFGLGGAGEEAVMADACGTGISAVHDVLGDGVGFDLAWPRALHPSCGPSRGRWMRWRWSPRPSEAPARPKAVLAFVVNLHCIKRFEAYSITSSARTSTLAGTSRPSALAVFMLSTISYLVGACTGRSAGFSLRRMRST
jgi:hypothetical protein